MSRQGGENRQETKGQNLPALPCKNTPATAGKQNHPAVPVPHTNRGRVCTTTKNVYLKTGTIGKPWQHKDVHGSVSSCSLSLCERSTKTFPHSWMTCHQIDSLSHWTLHDNVFHSALFSEQRQLMSFLTRDSIFDAVSSHNAKTEMATRHENCHT